MAPSPGPSAVTPAPPAFLERLRRRSEPDGFVPFDRFMEVALYDREVGYYGQPRSPFGPRGDYYTSGRLPLFARALSSRVAAVRDALGRPEPFALVDLGSGDGSMLAATVRALGDRGHAGGVEAVVVDRSPPRRAASLEAVTQAATRAGARARAAASVAELGPVRGIVLAHELLDALPARRLLWSGTAWRELGYRIEGVGLAPADRSAAGAPPAHVDRSLGEDDAGLLVERAPAAAGVVREVADHLVEGLLIVLDYGDEELALRTAHPHGTLAAIRGHRPVEPPSDRPGETDLSTFVDFTALRAAGASSGLVELAYRPQADALGAWGIARELELALRDATTSEEEVRTRLAAKSLLFGFESFHVLELAAPASATRLGAVSAAAAPGPS